MGYRNGYRQGTLATQVGDIELIILKMRRGRCLPSILEHRYRID